MKYTFTCILLLFIAAACQKSTYSVDPGCPPRPACEIQSHLVYNTYTQTTTGAGPYPYQFRKTFGPDDRMNYIDAFISVFWARSARVKGPVTYAGQYVYMRDSASLDTLMVVELDACNRPVKTVYQKSTTRFYTYDQLGRLSEISTAFSSGEHYIYRYDQYDNVTKIIYGTDTTKYLEFAYDYNQPINGGHYELGAVLQGDIQLVQLMGFFNTQPHHQLIQFKTTANYPSGTWTYINQVVNADGYLEYYESNIYNNTFTKAYLTWDCGSTGGHKY